jgi:hypothetical protein
MKTLNIAITCRLTPRLLEEIEAVDSKIKIWYIAEPAAAEAGKINFHKARTPRI